MGEHAVYLAISAVQKGLAHEGVSKDRKNAQQGFAYRGIDDVYAALAPLLAEHGLVILPRMLSRETVERTSKSGGTLFDTSILVEYDLVSSTDGSKHTVSSYGEAMDSGDKSVGKAMSYAYKAMAFSTFCIPTEGDHDADATTHEVLATTKSFAQKFPAQHQAIQEKLGQPEYGAEEVVTGPDGGETPSAAFIWRVGKHKSESVATIPTSYLEWFAREGKIDDHRLAAGLELDRRNSQSPLNN